ncbi:MAG: hypothetical protein HY897_14710 [Deltaproteobacteria bacterium]|nr:hypothetical protein [Deltaproteobacteria bacterium]
MAVEVHVDGVIERGKFAEFLEAAERWRRFRQEMGWCVPKILCGLSVLRMTRRVTIGPRAFEGMLCGECHPLQADEQSSIASNLAAIVKRLLGSTDIEALSLMTAIAPSCDCGQNT